jgi:glycosyltransferase involved in cell wall biosynthesis
MKYKTIFLLSVILLLIVSLLTLFYQNRENFVTAYKYTLSILVICKNEGMVIDEFVKHYKWQGVEHIYLIDNGSTDNMKQVLTPYIDEGYVSYFSLPEQHKQTQHYNQIYNSTIRNETHWLIVCDTDEYIYNRTPGETIISYIKNITDDVCAVVLRWNMFGSSGHKEQPQSIRKSFIWRKSNSDDTVKSIINTVNTHTINVHSHEYTENKEQLFHPTELKLNHYAIMSEEYFRKIKMANGDVSSPDKGLQTIRDMNYFERYDHKEVQDDELKKLVDN